MQAAHRSLQWAHSFLTAEPFINAKSATDKVGGRNEHKVVGWFGINHIVLLHCQTSAYGVKPYLFV